MALQDAVCLLSLLKPGWELVPSAAGTSKHGCPRDEAMTLTTGMPAPETMAGSAQQSCGTALCTPGPPTQYSSASCKLWNPHRKTFQSRQMYGSIQLQAQALGRLSERSAQQQLESPAVCPHYPKAVSSTKPKKHAGPLTATIPTSATMVGSAPQHPGCRK